MRGCWGRIGGRRTVLTFEVIARRLDDRGGGLARVNDGLRLVEGLAMPREEDEFKLSHYNTLTSWIDIDALLGNFGLKRGDLEDGEKVSRAVREFGARLPTVYHDQGGEKALGAWPRGRLSGGAV